MSGIGLTWALLLAPQHATPPSVATAQPWKLPRLNAVKAPGGGAVSPLGWSPQHASDASLRIAQVWS